MMGMLSACSPGHGDLQTELPITDAYELKMFDGEDGSAIVWADLMHAVKNSDIVIIGEQHGHPTGLATVAKLWEETINAGANGAVCLEFFERDEQIALDDYLTGITDEDAFIEAANRSQGNYPDGHRAMVEAAKIAGAPVFAANAPRRYIRQMSRVGVETFDNFTDTQHNLFVLPNVPTEGRYHDDFFEIMDAIHSDDAADENQDLTPEEIEEARKAKEAHIKRVQGMFRAQCMWDTTMADSTLIAHAKGYQPVFMVVGQFHVDNGGGIPDRIDTAAPGLRVYTITVESIWSDKLQEEDQNRANCIIYIGPRAE